MTTLSVVVTTWRRSAEMLLHSVHTLIHQTVQPLEILVVDTNTEGSFVEANRRACEAYPLVTFIHAPRSPLSVAYGMNVGLRRVQGDYAMATCMEMLFSRGTVEAVLAKVRPDCYIQSVCGVLPATVSVGDVTTVHERWSELCGGILTGSNVNISPGAAMIASSEWWKRVRGYDEVHYPVWENDVDNARQASITGQYYGTLGWNEAQLIHPEHPRLLSGYQTGGEWFFGTPEAVVRARPRNPNGWGEL